MKDHHKCSQCDTVVDEDNGQYKQCVETLEFLFPTILPSEQVNTASQSVNPTVGMGTSHIVVTTLSGERTTLDYDPNQTILSVKEIVEKELNAPRNKQRLLYNDIELKVPLKTYWIAFYFSRGIFLLNIRVTQLN